MRPSSGGNQTLFSVTQNRLRLLTGHAGKPFEKVTQTRTILQVLEQRLNRHPCAFEDPGAADLP